MKKSNRIGRKAPINKGAAQGRATISRSARLPSTAVSRLVDNNPKVPLWKFPSHRVLPRSATELRALRCYVANLGIHRASCVFESGEVQHLFENRSVYFIVTEMITVELAGDRYGADDVIGDGPSLEEYFKFHPKTKFWRDFRFEAKPKEEIMEWIERAGVSKSLDEKFRAAIFGKDEVEERTNGRLILTCDSRRVWACGGEFRLENLERGTVSEIPRVDALRMCREKVSAILDREMPESFRYSFYFNWWRSEVPADPADVINS